jgi:hypothetical protein
MACSVHTNFANKNQAVVLCPMCVPENVNINKKCYSQDKNEIDIKQPSVLNQK